MLNCDYCIANHCRRQYKTISMYFRRHFSLALTLRVVPIILMRIKGLLLTNHMQKEMEMILLLPFIKVLIVITLLFGLWVLLGGSVLFAFVSVLITGLLVVRQQDFI